MKHRIILPAIVIMAAVANVWSQTDSGEEALKTRWGIKGGINVATVRFESGTNSASLESVVGAAAGITLEHLFAPSWFFHSGLELSMKGFEFESGSSLRATAIYALLPATVGYKFNIGKGWQMEPRLGLYLAYGVAGDTSATASGDSGSASTFGDKILNPFDAGTLAGIYFYNGKFIVGIHGESGLTETNGDNFKVTGAKAYTNNVAMAVGYLF